MHPPPFSPNFWKESHDSKDDNKKVFAEPKIREGTGDKAKQLQVVRQHCLNALNVSSRKLLLNF